MKRERYRNKKMMSQVFVLWPKLYEWQKYDSMVSEVLEISYLLRKFIFYSYNCLEKSLLESHYWPLKLS